MSGNLFSFFIDIAVLVFLAATIIYVLRLTKSLNDFKAHRRDFDSVIANLLSSIDHAERSVKSLKQVSASEVAELTTLIEQSKAMSEELRIINDVGESMAKRLENAAELNRKTSPQYQGGVSKPEDYKSRPTKFKSKRADYASKLKAVKKPVDDGDMPSFMIQDRDLSNMDTSASNDGHDDHGGLQSQAEQELFAALRTSKRDLSDKGGYK